MALAKNVFPAHVKIQGVHNVENMMAAVAAAKQRALRGSRSREPWKTFPASNIASNSCARRMA